MSVSDPMAALEARPALSTAGRVAPFRRSNASKVGPSIPGL
jgi:hypothetical protein